MADMATNLQNGFLRVATEAKALRVSINSKVGDLPSLTTTAKSNLVAAINELVAQLDNVEVAPATESSAGTVELATVNEALTGTDVTRAVTAAGLRAVADALKTDILGVGVPAALDTLDELAAALGDDANFAATVTATLANKVDKVDVGDTNADFVATFEAGLV